MKEILRLTPLLVFVEHSNRGAVYCKSNLLNVLIERTGKYREGFRLFFQIPLNFQLVRQQPCVPNHELSICSKYISGVNWGV